MSLTKMVNGVAVPLTPQEEADLQAEWAAFEAGRTARANQAYQDQFDNNKLLRALALWTAQKLGVTAATARSEIIAIYKTL